MASLIETEPEGIIDFASEQQATLSLHNTTNGYVAFKVQTTHPKEYLVRPAVGKISPFGTIDVRIMRKIEDGADAIEVEELRKHRFLVRSCEVPAVSECSAQAWGAFDKASIRDKRFTVDDTGPRMKMILTLHKFGNLSDNPPLKLCLTNMGGEKVFDCDFNPSETSSLNIGKFWNDVAKSVGKDPRCIRILTPDGIELKKLDELFRFLDVGDLKELEKKLQTEKTSLKVKLKVVQRVSARTVLLVAFASAIAGYVFQRFFP